MRYGLTVRRTAVAGLAAVATLLAGCGGGGSDPVVPAPGAPTGPRIYAISGVRLVSFTPTAPATLVSDTTITGLVAGETLVGIDFRPQNGFLYGLGVNATTDTATLYSISIPTGTMTPVGSAGSIAFTTDGVAVVDLPDPATVGYGVDFNPAVDRLRVVAGGINFRVNPNNGAPVDGNNGTGGAPAGVNPDGGANGGTLNVDAAAYTNNQSNNGNVTTLYTLDSTSNSLFIQNPPNVGTQATGLAVTLGGAPLDFTIAGGFDIPAGINAAASNGPASGSASAVLGVGGVTSLYSLNLTTGAATLVGPVGTGALAIQGMALRSDLGGLPSIALSSTGPGVGALVRFVSNAPGTTTSQVITGLAGTEQLVGIDWRPATGQLYGLGVDATANTATLYLIDPQTGAATAVGASGQILFAGPVDLPDPAVASYGFNFNPMVDRIRVTTSTGLNFRVNPITGAPVTPLDGAINGGSAGVSGASYTNAFGGATVTTLYTIDSVSGQLFIQNPPNNGTQTAGLRVLLAGAPLTFAALSGFDIPASVSVMTSNAAATGSAFATLTVGGVTSLYQINLATGVATTLGTVGVGATSLSGLAVGDGP